MEGKPTESSPPAHPPVPVRPDHPAVPRPEVTEADSDSRRFYTASLLGFFAHLPPLPRSRPNQDGAA